MHVVVLGCGWAGIAAAIEAVKHGWKVTVVEERPYIGGRARSFPDTTTGTTIDNGQHVMIGAYTGAHNVMSALGTLPLITKQRAMSVAFADATGKRTVLDASRLPGLGGMVFGMLSMQGVRISARLACLRLASRIMKKQVSVHNLTCEEFLRNELQPQDVVTRFWEPLVLATLNAPLNKAAASLLVNVVRLTFAGGRGASGLWIPTVGLSELIAPFPEWLNDNGGTLLTSVSADSITHYQAPSHGDNDGLMNVTMEGGSVVRTTSAGMCVHLSNGQTLQADAVISAMPQRALHRLVQASALPVSLPQESPMSPIVSVYLWYDATWLPVDFTAVLGTTIQWVFNKHRIHDGLCALTVSAAVDEARLQSNEFIAQCDAELRSVFPESASSTLLHGKVIKERLATPLITPEYEQQRQTAFGSNVVFDLHQPTGVGDQHMTPRNALFAISGDWTLPGLPATIESAVRSGVRAVEQVAALSTAV